MPLFFEIKNPANAGFCISNIEFNSGGHQFLFLFVKRACCLHRDNYNTFSAASLLVFFSSSFHIHNAPEPCACDPGQTDSCDHSIANSCYNNHRYDIDRCNYTDHCLNTEMTGNCYHSLGCHFCNYRCAGQMLLLQDRRKIKA